MNPSDSQQSKFYPDLKLLIDGQWGDASDGATGAVFDPATGDEIARYPMATVEDVERAIAASQRGFKVWSRTAPAKRVAILMQAAALVRARVETIGRTITLELGKPLAEALIEAERCAAVFEWHAAESLRAYGRIVPGPVGLEQNVWRQPIGPVASFTPWNGPAASPARKMTAALAAGCSLVIKPAEETPGSALLLARCLTDAGVPDGVLNVVFGDPGRISQQLIASPVIRAMAFTGSVPVGRHLAELAGRHLKPVIMELGGHSPVIVCADADAEKVAALSARTKFRNGGQICISPTRFYVHQSRYAAFVDAFVKTTLSIRIGNGFDAASEMGPLANDRRRDAIDALVTEAVAQGAHLACGGKRIGERGYFYAPTVLTDVPDHAQIMQTEPFGPVAIITPYTDVDDVIARANNTDYGLAAYIFTDSASLAHRFASEIEAGGVSINQFSGAPHDAPFGGVKNSGYGREGGSECFEGYLVTKFVSHRMNPF